MKEIFLILVEIFSYITLNTHVYLTQPHTPYASIIFCRERLKTFSITCSNFPIRKVLSAITYQYWMEIIPLREFATSTKNDKQEAKAIKKDTSTDMNYLDTDFPFYKIHPQRHLKTSNSIQTIHSSNRYKKTRASDLLTTVN